MSWAMMKAIHPRPVDDALPRAVWLWLLICILLTLIMMQIGAWTRLTDSGLSMVEWRPIRGIIPPLSQAEWNRLFALYQEIPEFALEYPDMDLSGFRRIFWWEYIHRAFGRFLGLVFLLPFLVFLWRRQLKPKLALGLMLVLALGGAQALVGRLMVESGWLDGRVDVLPLMLALHLGLALLLIAGLTWPLAAAGWSARSTPRIWQRMSEIILGAVGLTILTGAITAGLDAGYIHDSFPLMSGQFLPEDYRLIDLDWLTNALTGRAAAQFHHRWIAVATAVSIVVFGVASHLSLPLDQARPFLLAALLAALQLGLGIFLILNAVPAIAAATHQLGAVLIFIALLTGRARL